MNTKICTMCHYEKSLDSFHNCAKGHGGLDSRCKDCKAIVYAEWQSRYLFSRSKTRKLHRQGVKAYLDERRSVPCTDCGQSFSLWLMEFDHIGKKSIEISIIQHNHWSKSRIDKELLECEVVCIGCHRLRTEARRPVPKLKDGNFYPRFKALYEKTKYVMELKNKPCKICGKSFHSSIMEFDHRDKNTKIMPVADMMKFSMEKLKEEIAKCDLLCAFCHRNKTHEEQSKLKTKPRDRIPLAA